jgi:hypothetical protein
MGCQTCKGIERFEGQSLKELMKSIQNENISGLKFFLKAYHKSVQEPSDVIVNKPLIKLSTVKFNLLAYSVVCGTPRSFKYLYERCGCSFELMVQNFAQYEISPFTIICEKNHLDLLRYFLPLFFRYHRSHHEVSNTTLDFQQTRVLKTLPESLTPIQAACANGSIAIVDYLTSKHSEYQDPLIDIHEKNEETGENCALISVRSGSIAMVKLLLENYQLDFYARNKAGETALQICAVCSAKHPAMPYGEVFMFLVEEVGLDVRINYEEILLVLCDRELIMYTEGILRNKGIEVNKRDLDRMYMPNRKVNLQFDREEEVECLKNELETSNEISSIERASCETPFHTGSFTNWGTALRKH